MTLLVAIRRLLSILAVVGFALSPVAAPAAVEGTRAPTISISDQEPARGVTVAADASSDMPCCDHEKPATPDCQKGCPFAALCVSNCVVASAIAQGVLVRTAHPNAMIAADEVAPDGLSQAPPPRPPRT